MSLIGKVTVINSLMASLFVYKMQVLPVLSNEHVKQVEEVILDFLWHGRKPKISMVILKCCKKEGGLGLVDIKTKHEALLVNWINDFNSIPQIGNLAMYFIGVHVTGGNIWQFNMTQKDSEQMFPGSGFWHKLLHMWHGYNYHDPQSKEKVAKQNIFFNSSIWIQGKPVKSSKEYGILSTVGQLWLESGFQPFLNVKENFDLNIS